MRRPKRKVLVLRLRSTEALTNLGARLVKGRRTLGTGKMRQLNGTRSLRLKLSRKLRRGRYVIDVAGNDARGQRRVATLALRIR